VNLRSATCRGDDGAVGTRAGLGPLPWSYAAFKPPSTE